MRHSILLIGLLVTACHHSTQHQNASSDSNSTNVEKPSPIFATGDAVLQMIRDRVTGAIKGEDNFQVQSIQDATFIFPVGTVMIPGRSIGLNRTACAPATPPGDYPMPSLSTAVSMKGSAALDLGLDPIGVAKLASAGVKAGQNDTFTLSVDQPKGEFLLDDELADLLKQSTCAAYLQGKTVNIVRGFIIGKRSYELGRSGNAGGSIGVANVGNLSVQVMKDNMISLVDQSPVQFLQIVSSVTIPAANGAPAPQPQNNGGPPPPPPPPPGPGGTNKAPLTAFISAPVAPTGPGQVYVQRDVADTSDRAAQVKASLTSVSLKVVPQVDSIDSSKMPKTAQVRYFNKGDEGVANRALASLRSIFPDATTQYVGLSAPPGQLEVWLPKVGNAVSGAKFTERPISSIPGAALATRPAQKVPVGALVTKIPK